MLKETETTSNVLNNTQTELFYREFSDLQLSGGNRNELDFEASESVDEDGADGNGDEDLPETIENKQEEKAGMIIADLYMPSHITKHRIVRAGRGPIQLQFMVEWHPGWTSDIALAHSVIRKHSSEALVLSSTDLAGSPTPFTIMMPLLQIWSANTKLRMI
jgi:hypothetical protein